MRRSLHRLGTLLLAAGALALVWSVVVWRWQDPASLLYTRYQQHRLAGRLEAVVASTSAPASPREAAAAARSFRRSVRPGDPIGRLVVPRLGLSQIVVEGTSAGSLRMGPGREPRSLMPGEGGLVYLAGHRTTFGAPFARIDALRAGDSVQLSMPYGTFFYVVTGHTVVASDDLRVLRARRTELVALQACHPRFFATQRYIVWARLRRWVDRSR